MTGREGEEKGTMAPNPPLPKRAAEAPHKIKKRAKRRQTDQRW